MFPKFAVMTTRESSQKQQPYAGARRTGVKSIGSSVTSTRPVTAGSGHSGIGGNWGWSVIRASEEKRRRGIYLMPGAVGQCFLVAASGGKLTLGLAVGHTARQVSSHEVEDSAGAEERSNKDPLLIARLQRCPDAKGKGDPSGGPKRQCQFVQTC